MALPLDFADAIAALTAEVLGDFDEAQDVFLSRIDWLVRCVSGEGEKNLKSGWLADGENLRISDTP